MTQKCFFPCSLPISSSLPWAWTPYGGIYVTWNSCLQGPFIQSFFCRETNAFDFHFSRFRDWSHSIIQRFEVKLTCKFIVLHLKKYFLALARLKCGSRWNKKFRCVRSTFELASPDEKFTKMLCFEIIFICLWSTLN